RPSEGFPGPPPRPPHAVHRSFASPHSVRLPGKPFAFDHAATRTCHGLLPPFAAPPTPLTRATGTSVVMQIQDLPYPDPGVPDARSGPRFLWWLGRNQLGGQFKSLAWGLLHFASVSALRF